MLLDRDAELSAARACVDAALSGAGRLLVLDGPPGIGKTRLCREVRDMAAAAGLRVLSATAGELESDLPFSVARQLLLPAAEHQLDGEDLLAAEARPDAAGVEERGLATPSVGAAETRAWDTLHALCRRLTGERPLLLCVDDAHWADVASVKALLYIARRRATLPLVLVVAMRPESMAPRHRALQLLAGSADLVIEPRPLSPETTGELISHFFGRDCSERFAAECAEASGGNPLLLEKLLDEVAADGLAPCDDDAERIADLGSVSVAQWALSRVRQLGTNAVTVAGAVAVLGTHATLPLIAQLSRLSPRDVEPVLDDLMAGQLLAPTTPLTFVHPLVRSAVYRHMPPSLRSSRHRDAARLLEAAGATADDVAAHLISSAPSADAWVLDRLRQAGERALSMGAPESAVIALRRAAEEDPVAVDSGLLLRLGQAAAVIGDRSAREHLSDAYERAVTAADRAHAAVELARVLAFSGEWERALDLLARALDGVGDREIGLRLEAERLLLLESSGTGSDIFIAEAERVAAGLEGQTPGERLVLAHLASARLFRCAPREQVHALATTALADGRLLAENGAESPTWLYAAALLWVVGDYVGADEELRRGERSARSRGAATAVAQIEATRAWIRFELGDLADAEALARAVLESGVLGPRAAASRYARACLVTVLTECGRPGEAAALLAEPHAGRSLDRFEALLQHAHGELRVAEGDAGGADDILAAGRWCDSQGIQNPAEWAWRTDAALALARAGHAEQALELARTDVERARSFGLARPLGRALHALALASPPSERGDLLQEAVDVLASSPARLAHAAALLDLGRAARSRGRIDEARAAWRDALALADGCGAAPLAREAKALLANVGVRPRRAALTGPSSLTPTEAEVCRLAARGMSNREAAAALFVSVKTVEKHLGSAYAKLGVRRRGELASILSEATGTSR